ncbi:hypothetical protein BpHYR1_029285 [Brachionus plicatilis]|uniref:Uncharacterized protein n=1 Tax=Brachionus plicatilis TaxID=10195 RepID=A0A3M7PPQ3_BRAPC|nr:hypothetical protein BpHYR1_029285 [Brachionus plicatilis]
MFKHDNPVNCPICGLMIDKTNDCQSMPNKFVSACTSHSKNTNTVFPRSIMLHHKLSYQLLDHAPKYISSMLKILLKEKKIEKLLSPDLHTKIKMKFSTYPKFFSNTSHYVSNIV